MRPKASLFLKLFVAFWLTTIAILTSWVIASDYFDARPPAPPHAGERIHGPPHRFVLRLLYELQQEDLGALHQTVEEVRKKHGLQVFLLDSDDNDILGQPVSADVRAIAEKLNNGRRRAFKHIPGGRLAAHELHRRDIGRVRAVFQFAKPHRDIMDALGGSLALRILLAIVISGLVCFAITRIMTRRIKAMSRASRALAAGNLETRIEVRERGGDETDQLARDFNSMAGQLEERLQAQKRLLGDVSHELRSPLARLRIALALAEEDPDNSKRHLTRIEDEAEQLEELIGQLLASQTGEVQLTDHIELGQLLEQLCADTRFEGQATGKQVTLSRQATDILVASHGDLLHRAFNNVLRNALQHTADGTAITVALKADAGHSIVTVEDQGQGVPEAELGHIFEAFYRVDTARSRDTGGHGLGLAIAQRAIAQHGGQIEAANTGNGLRITVSLPTVELD